MGCVTRAHRPDHRPSLHARGAALLATLLVAALTGLLSAAPATPASAHAALQASSPADGATITAVPPEIMLRFNEPIGADFARVTVKKGGASAHQGSVEVDGNTVYRPINPSMSQGDWTVSYSVVSEDGHRVSGSVSFTYDTTSGRGSTPDSTGGGGSGAGSTGNGSGNSASSSGGGSTGGGSSSSAPTTSASGSAEAPAAPSSSASSSAEPTSQAPSSTSEPSSTSSSPSSSSSSSSGSATDGESPRPLAEGNDETAADEASDDSGVPSWVWVLGAAVLVLALIVALVARARRRGDHDQDERIDLESYRG